MRLDRLGEKNARFGVTLTQETRNLISKRIREVGSSKGKNNCKAKKWKIISPNHQEFFVHGELQKFCDDMNIGSYSGLVQAGIRNIPITRGKSKGWIAFEINSD